VSRWGVGSFENDEAAGWLAKLGSITLDDLTKIFLHAADNPGYLEAPDASVAVAAAEVIAALNDFPATGAPQEIVEWAKRNRQVSTSDITALAIRALDRVRRNSELKDLWLEADGLNDWIAAIHELQTRLGN
jgi:hypothetical protein